jgi:hypothetical protein
VFNLKTAVIGAAAGFAVSFIAGIIGGVEFLIILLRALLSAAFSALLISGVRFLYVRFLGEEQTEAPSGAVKSSPAGSVVDITLDDAELPDTDTAPDFIVGNGITNPYKEDGDKKAAASENEAAKTAEPETLSRLDEQTVPHETVRDEFVPYDLGKTPLQKAASSAESAPVTPSAVSASAGTGNGQAGADSPDAGASDAAQGATLDENAGGDSVLDTLPDLEGFTPQEHYADDGGDDFSFGNSSDDFQPRSMQRNASVDLSDAKNIAAAIRTALHNET